MYSERICHNPMERKLASIQLVSHVEPIPGADNIEQITVMGWKLISRKNEFKAFDLCVFFEIDSILPDGAEWAEFLKKKDYRVRTMKLAKFGVVSQGLALPLDSVYTPGGALLSELLLQEGDDVTSLLRVTKYEKPDEITNLRMSGKTLRPFISGVPKTDEQRIQSATWILDRMAEKEWYATLKYDGTSFTAVYDSREKRLRVASRNCELEDDGNLYWDIAKKYELPIRLLPFPDIVIQGEIVGPGIQGNKMNRKEHELYVFNVYNLKDGCYSGWMDISQYCALLGLKPVQFVTAGKKFNLTIDEMTALTKGLYEDSEYHREGLVFRPYRAQLDPILGQLSFKVINPDYLIQNNE